MTQSNHFAEKTSSTSYDPAEKFLARIGELPSFPSLAIEALSLSLEEDVDVEKLGRVIEGDVAITMRVFKVANSVAKKPSLKISSLPKAISYIGLTNLQCILANSLSISLRESIPGEFLALQRDLWSHSLACAIFSQLISRCCYPEIYQEAFAAGLLHDVGKVVLLVGDPEKYKEVMEKLAYSDSSIDAEFSVFNVDHTLIGRRLAKGWVISEKIEEAITYHHLGFSAIRDLGIHRELLYIVKLGNIFAHEFFLQQRGSLSSIEEREIEEIIKRLAISPGEIEGIKENFLKIYEEKAKLLELEGDIGRLYLSTIRRANARISELALEINLRKEELERLGSIQQLCNEIGLKLSKCSSFSQVFKDVAESFVDYSPIKAGLVYVLDRDNWLLDGYIWHRDKGARPIRCFLDREGTPIWDSQTSKYSPLLKELFSSYRERIKFKEDPCELHNVLLHKGPFYTLPLCSQEIALRGELCLAPVDVGHVFSEGERVSLSQIVKFVVASLENISLRDKLEKKTEELTFALWKNQQLQQRMLHTERLAIAGQLAAGAAHEINNPLAVINARAQLLHLKETDPTKQKHLLQITEQIERISSILSRLMDFARPAPPSLSVVDVASLLDKVLDFVAPGLRKQGISVEKDYDREAPPIKADPSQLEQVFLNLIINAQHALEKKEGGKIRVSTSYYRPKNKLVVTIEDNGCGIPAKYLKNIFDPFFTTKAPGKGTGLGLSISNSIVENHYGRLEIRSQEKEGTKAIITLPINIEELRQLDSLSNISVQRDSFNLKPHILVVDDETHIQEILLETLESESMTATACSNGAEALEQLDRRRFDLILLDMKMPVLDGLSLINAIKNRDMHIPIIVITGMATHEEIKDALNRGVYKCIRKPFHIKSLLKDIKDVLAREGFFEGYEV